MGNMQKKEMNGKDKRSYVQYRKKIVLFVLWEETLVKIVRFLKTSNVTLGIF